MADRQESYMTFGRNIGYMRWYDSIPELAQAVRQMEKMPLAKQQWLASAIVSLMPLHQIPQRTDGLKKLGSEKLLGLMKSKGKRRWYDQDPLVHQAFNYLYLMSNDLRLEMAIKILICNQALEVLKISEHNASTGIKLVRSIFDKPLSYLLQRTHFTLLPPSGRASKRIGFTHFQVFTDDNSPALSQEQSPAPVPALPVKTAEATEMEEVSLAGIASEKSDMKIVRLKSLSELK